MVSQMHWVLTKEAWPVPIDLKDAYWHIPIHHSFRKFLGFVINGQKFQFTSPPFGLNIGPLVFTRLTKSILKIFQLAKAY